jgi:hypothetical protein
LIAFHSPAPQECRIVGFELLRGKRFDLSEKIEADADRSRNKLVIEEVVEVARCRIPPNMPDLSRLPVSLRVRVAFRRGVVITGSSRPVGMSRSVEGPVR